MIIGSRDRSIGENRLESNQKIESEEVEWLDNVFLCLKVQSRNLCVSHNSMREFWYGEKVYGNWDYEKIVI